VTKTIHFIGIGGTAMVGAALIARELGFHVTGSDQKLYPPTSDILKDQSISYNESYAANHLNHAPDTIVLGNAISRGNAELEAALNLRIPILSMPEFIGEYAISRRRSLTIAGTHGKTTTTALVAHLLHTAGIDCGYMIGGAALNFETGAHLGTADVFVTEGDEYDTSIFDHRSKFLSYRPTHAIINNIEFDHADIFADLVAVEKAFARLVKIIPANGQLATNADNHSCMTLAASAHCRVVTFGTSKKADYQLLEYDRGHITYAAHGQTHQINSPLLGTHNHLNTLAALAILEDFQLGAGTIAKALSSFKGVKRRLELKLDTKDFTIIEDFAHHPTAIRANTETLRAAYPGRRLVILIEPRSNTLVRNIFQRELTDALALADVIFTDEIYRKEKYSEAERLDIQRLIGDLESQGRAAYKLPINDRAEFVCSKLVAGDVVCFMTNGSFGGLIEEVVQAIT